MKSMIGVASILAFCVFFPIRVAAQAPAGQDTSLASQYQALHARLNDIQVVLHDIDHKVKREPLWKQIRTDFISNFLWDLVSNKTSTTNRIARFTSILGLVFLLLRIAFFFGGKTKAGQFGGKITSSALFLYLLLAVPTLFFLSFSGGIAVREADPQNGLESIRDGIRVIQEELRQMHTDLVAERPQGDPNREGYVLPGKPDPLHLAIAGGIDDLAVKTERIQDSIAGIRKGLARQGLLVLNTLLVLTCVVIKLWPKIKGLGT